MRPKLGWKTVAIVAILLATSLPLVNYAASFLGSPGLLEIRGVNATGGTPILGIDCGYGSRQAVLDPVSGLPVGDGLLDTSCTWAGDVDGDGAFDPLVGDNPTFFAGGAGGGFTAEILAQGLPASVNGFDITLSYDARFLDAVKFDQTGLPFNGAFTVQSTIDHANGVVRLAQVLLAGSVSGNVILFKLRFDVVGVGTSPLTISQDVITNPGAVPHKTQQASLNSADVFDPGGLLGWQVSWKFSPNPEVPGSPLTFTAVASCPGCGILTYDWDLDSDPVTANLAGNPAVTTAPPPIVHRVALTVSDGVSAVMAVRRLPLTVAVTGPSSIAVGASGTWNGLWLGGYSTWSGTWRFCPGVGTTANAICHKPAPTTGTLTTQTNTQTLNSLVVPLGAYHFGGVYTDTLRITDSQGTVAPQVGASVSVTATFFVNVTGTPLAYTVTVVPSNTNPRSGDLVTYTVTVAYASTYPTLIGTTNPRSSFFDISLDFGDLTTQSFNSALKDDAKIKYFDTIPALTATLDDPKITFTDTNNNGVWDFGESIVYDTNANGVYDGGEPVITGATPASGTAVKDDPKIRFWDNTLVDGFWSSPEPVIYDANSNGLYDTGELLFLGGSLTWNPGEVVVYDTNGNGVYDAGDVLLAGAAIQTGQILKDDAKIKYFDLNNNAQRDSNEGIVYDNDAPTGVFIPTATEVSIVGTPNCSGNTAVAGGTLICLVTKTYSVAATQVMNVLVRTQETGGTAVSKIIEVGRTAISVKGGVTPLTGDFSCTPNPANVGDSVNCTATASGGTAPYIASFSFGDGATSSCNIALASGTCVVPHVYSTKGTYSVTLTLTDSGGSTPVTVVHSQTINPLALAGNFTFDPVSPTTGKPVTFTASAAGGTGPYTFSWTFGDTTTGVGSPVSHTYATKGTFVVTLTIRDANGVTVNVPKNVVVAGQPVVVTVSCGTATAGKPVTCTAAASGGTSPYTFTWTVDGVVQAGQTGSSFTTTFATKGSHTIGVTATDANNVSSTPATASVAVAAQPLTVTVSCGTFTAGKPGTCTATAAGGTSPYTFTWTVDGVIQAGQAGSSFTTTFATKGSHTVSVVAKDANNVSSTAASTSVTVAGQPLTVTVSCGTATAGKPVTCTASASGGTSPYTFTWTIDGVTQTEATSSITRTFATKGSHTISVTARDANNVTSNAASTTLTVAAQPLTVTVSCGTATAGKPVTCTATAAGGTSPYTFTWTVDGTVQAGQAGSSFTTTFATKGSHTIGVTAKDANNVSSTPATTTVAVAAQPLTVTISCGAFTAGKPGTCTATASGGTSPYTFAWTVDGVVQAGQTGSSFTTTFPTKGSNTIGVTAKDANSVSSTQATASVAVAGQPLTVTVSCGTATAGKPVTCTATASGGTSPYTFTWTVDGVVQAGQAGSSFTTTFATKGSHTIGVTAKDANNVTSNPASTTLTVAAQPLTVTVSCGTFTAGKPGTCTATASGGTSPYTFTWTVDGTIQAGQAGSSFTTTFATKSSHIIGVTAKDANNVSSTQATANVTVAGQPLTVTVSCGTATAGKPVTCTATASGGTSPYTFTWTVDGVTQAGQTASTFTTTFATKGSHTISVTARDANSVTSPAASTTVAVAGQPLTVAVNCGAFTAGKPGTCTATASGGTSPYTFTWTVDGVVQAGQAGSSFTTTFATKGSHTVSVTAKDANNVSSTAASTTVTVAAQPLTITASASSPVTAGKPASFTVTITGGTAPYTWTWDFGDGSGGLMVTTHTYTVKGSYTATATATDANGATAQTSITVTVAPQPLAITASCGTATAGKPVSCTASATGGTAPYTFTWDVGKDGSIDGQGVPFSTTFPTKGTFSIDAIVRDANGQTARVNVPVTVVPQPLAINASCQPGATAGKPVQCSATASGGTAPYTFTWDVGKDGTTDGTGATFTTIFPVKGSYSIDAIVKDANGATARMNIAVTVAAQPLTVIVSCGTATAGKPVQCTASASGGTAPYTFTWAFGDGTTGSGNPVTHSYAVKGTFVASATGRDANGASATGQASVVVAPQPLTITANCTSGAGGSVTCDASATGGTGPYVFTWDVNKDGTIDGTGVPFTTTFPTKGTFSIDAIVRDANGQTAKVNVPVTVSPQPLIITASCQTAATAGKPVSCGASATGGTAPYTFTWDVGKDGLIDGSGATFSTSFPTKGSFSIDAIVRDANGAIARMNLPVSVAPQPLAITASCQPGATAGKPVSCSASATGGTGPYTFTWDVGKDGLIDGTGVPFSTTFAVKGSYSIDAVAKDANGATAKVNLSVVVAPQPLTVSIGAVSGATAGKPVTFTATVSGGTGPYTISWTFGDGTTGTGASVTHTYSVKGSYTVAATARDANAAIATTQTSVTVAPQPLAITATCGTAAITAGKPVTCNASATGGTGPYTFTWDVGKDGLIDGQGVPFTTTFPTKGAFSIDAIVRDANGQTARVNIPVTVAPQPLTINASCQPGATAGKPIICDAGASGGTAPYTFTWDVGKDGLIDGTGASFNTVFPTKGTFSIDAIVKDANGATARVNIPVPVSPQPLTVNVQCPTPNPTAGKPVDCNAVGSGGTQPYTYSWSFGDGATGTGNPVTHTYTVKGTYTVSVTIRDANGASATGQTSIVVSPQPLTITANCISGAGGSVTCDASATGGTAPYTFTWDVGKDGLIDGTGVPFTTTFPTKGTFSIDAIVRDANGQTAKVNVPVTISPQPLIITASCQTAATAGKPVSCGASATGGTAPYTFTWDVGKDGTIDGTGPSFNTVFPTKGTFSIDAIVRDANGATARMNIPVSVSGQPLTITASCLTGATAGKPVQCSASATGGTGPYTFTWDVGKDGIIEGTAASFTTTFAVKGSYSIDAIVKDANGATTRVNIPVTVGPQPLTGDFTFTQPVLAGQPATFTGSATGGTGPYRFSWDVGKDGTIDATGNPAQLTFPTKGSVSVDMIVVDANNAQTKVNKLVGITGTPIVADFTFTPTAPTAGKPVTFTVTGVSGGTQPYSFAWDVGKDGTIDGTGPGFTTSFPTKGTFSIDLVVTDANGAVARFNKAITVTPQPLTITANCGTPAATAGKPLICDATASGGTGPYTFTWDVGKDGLIDGTGSTFTTTFPTKGTFSIDAIVKDVNGATARVNIPVTVAPQPLTVSVNAPAGATTGKPATFSATVSGGTGPYTVSWSFGDGTTGTGSSVTHSYATKGTFTVTATAMDANSATAQGTASLSVAPQPLMITASCTSGTAGKPVTCDASATGGTAPYSFLWDLGKDGIIDGQTVPFTTTFATKGTYSIDAIVRDANGQSTRVNIPVIVSPQPLTINASCQNGTAGKPIVCDAGASGGTAPYTFTWDIGKDGTIDGTGVPFTTIFPTKGMFSIDAIVKDANGATARLNIPVQVSPQPLTITATCGAAAAGATAGKPVDCTATASGGTAPYSFTWDVGKDGIVDGSGASFTTSFAVKGSYSIDAMVRDANGQVVHVNIPVVVAPQPLTGDFTFTQPVLVGSPATFTGTATGGTGPYTFRWDVGKDGTIDATGQTVQLTFPTKGSVSVDLIIVDANGAQTRVNKLVGVTGTPIVGDFSFTPTAPTAGKPVTFTASATGGTAPYTFTWDVGKDGTIDGTGPTFSTSFPTKGTFSVDLIITDANGATTRVNKSILVSPQPLVITAFCGTATGAPATAGKPVDCNATASGGTAPYTFTWDVGKDGLIDGTGASFNAIFPTKGTFSIDAIVKDANGATTRVNIPVAVSPQPLTGDFTFTQPVIAGQPATFTGTATGGTAPYRFEWDIGKDGIIDAAGNPAQLTFPAKGSVSVDLIITDANGAQTRVNKLVGVTGTPIVADFIFTPTAPTAGKPVTFTVTGVSGGTAPYSFRWDIGKDGIIEGNGQDFITSFPTKGTFSIDLIVVDANGAVFKVNKTILVSPQPLTITATCGQATAGATAGKPVDCQATASGGTAPYNFRWDVGKDGLIDGAGASFTATFPVKGLYSIDAIVSDANGATVRVNVPVTVAPQPLTITASCSPNGTAGKPIDCSASATGGTGPYSFAWDVGKDGIIDGTGPSFTTSFAASGTFSIDAIVQDANGATAKVNIPVIINAQNLVITAQCSSATAGKPVDCTASTSGGVPPVTITWDVGKDGIIDGTGPTFTTTFPVKGTYSIDVIATDATGARATTNVPVVVSPQPLVITAFCGTATGAPATAGKPVDCSASASGGTGPYSFAWDVGKDGTIDATGPGFTTSFPTKGLYSIDAIVRDANGATAKVNLPVQVMAQPLVITAQCLTGTAGKPIQCTASASGGTAPYLFTWDVGKDGTVDATGDTVSLVFPVKGTYSVDAIVKDANGATARVNIVVVIMPQPLVIGGIVMNPTIPTVGKPVTFTVSVSGGTAPYKVFWSISQVDSAGGKTKLASLTSTLATGNQIQYTFATKGMYSVGATVIDANGASATIGGPIPIRDASGQVVGFYWYSAGHVVGGSLGGDIQNGGTDTYDIVAMDELAMIQPDGSLQTMMVQLSGQAMVRRGPLMPNGVIETEIVSMSLTGNSPMGMIMVRESPTMASMGRITLVSGSFFDVFVADSFFDVFTELSTDSQPGMVFMNTEPVNVQARITAIPPVGSTYQPKNIIISVSSQPLVITASCSNATAGKPVDCTASATGGTSPYSFTWDIGKDGTIDGQGSGFTTVFAVKGTYSIDAMVTDANSDTARVNLPISVTAQPLVITANCFGGTATGAPVFCTASASGGTQPYLFSWDVGKDGTIDATGQNVSFTFPTKGTRSIDAIVKDANGATAKVNLVVTVVGQPLRAAFGYDPVNPTASKPVTFTANVTGGTPPYIIEWSFGDGTSGTGNTVTHTYAVKGTYNVTMAVRDANGDSVVRSASITVFGQPLVADFTFGTPKSGTVITFTGTASGGTAPYMFTWTFGDGASAIGNPVTHTYLVPGTYNVTMTVKDANGASVTVAKVVDVHAPLTAIDFAPVHTIAGKTDFVAKITGGTPPIVCTWTFGDGTPAQTGCNTSHTFVDSSGAQIAGTFSVTLTVTDGNGVTLTTTKSVLVDPAPTLIRGRVHWTHHLNGFPGVMQTFEAKVRNPSTFTVEVTLTVDIFTDTGVFVDRVMTTKMMAPGSTDLSFVATWTPTMAGKFMFTATLSYRLDFGDLSMPADGVNEMAVGTDKSKSGSFAVVP